MPNKIYNIRMDEKLHDEAVELSEKLLGSKNFQALVRKLVIDAVKQAKGGKDEV